MKNRGELGQKAEGYDVIARFLLVYLNIHVTRKRGSDTLRYQE